AGGTLQNLEIKSIRDTPLSGAQHGVAIYAWDDAGTDRTIKIENCIVYDYQKNGMALNGANLYVEVRNCTVTGSGPLGSGLPAQNGIQLGWGATGIVDNNTISDNWYTPESWAACGGLIYGSDDVIITNNTLDSNLVGVYYYGGNGTIAYNTFTNNKWAINLYGDAYIYGNTFSGNTYDLTYMAEIVGTNHFWDVIQNAINNATDGDTIKIYDGVYNENLVIDKEITLEVGSTPIIDGNQAGPCITINANNVTIDGLELFNGTYGIVGSSSGVDNCIIQNCIIHDNVNTTGTDGIGIMFWTGTDSVDFDDNAILNNEIYNNGRQGIFFGSMASSPAISDGNNISGNTIYNNGNDPTPIDQYGIQLSYADDNILMNNEIYGHDDWFFAQGIYLMASYNNTIWYNDIYDNLYGIAQWAWSRTYVGSNNINYNNIYNNSAWGVHNFDATTMDAEYNYWGHPSGPYHSSNPTGQGDNVSDNVDFIPWLDDAYPDDDYDYNETSGVEDAYYEDVPAGTETTVDGTADTDTTVTVNSTNPIGVTILLYEGNPEGTNQGAYAMGKYLDIIINDTSGVQWPINITIYYTLQDLIDSGLSEDDIVGIMFWNGTAGEWQYYNDTGVNKDYFDGTYIGYVWANAWHLTPVGLGGNDTEAPTTTKTVSQPKYGPFPPYDLYVTSSTRFNLTAVDNPSNGSGVNATYYRIWYNGAWTPWMIYTGNFTLTGECKHYLEFYSIDNAGNAEAVHNQTHYVDDTPPQSFLVVGDPKWPQNQGATFVTTSTVITLYANDIYGSCNVGSFHMHYRIWNGTWTPWQVGGLGEVINITFSEECKHYIEYYAEDNLGNTETTIHNRTFYVDDTPPTSSIELGEPKCGYALEFDGNDYVDISNPDNFNFLAWTYELWFKTNSTTGYPNLIGRQFASGHGWTIHLTPQGWVRIRIDTNSATNQAVTAMQNYRDGEWHHVAVTLDDVTKSVQIYVDGILRNTGSYVGNFVTGGGFLRIAGPAVGAGYYIGALDEVRVYNVILSASDVLDNYLGDIVTSGLVSWWDFNEGSGTTAYDSVDANDGTIYGATYTDTNLRLACITTQTPIFINATDPGTCASNNNSIYYRIWNGSSGWTTWQHTINTNLILYIKEECIHYIEYYALDALGNNESVIHNITLYIDDSTPSITKTVGDPHVEITPDEYWVTTSTPITIDATDAGCCPGMIVEYSVDGGVWVDITTSLPFTYYFTTEGDHTLAIRAYDCVGNIVYDNETFHVDDTPPLINKTVGDPHCEIAVDEYCVTTSTNIIINASDAGVGLVNVSYRIWYSGIWTTWFNITASLPYTFTFAEECVHYLEIYVEDNLGNSYTDNETFYVDDTTPEIIKTVGSPNVEVVTGEYYVTTSTPITIDAYDLGCCDNLTVEYRIWYMGTWSDWTEVTVPYDLYFTEECTHYLEIKAYDCLGHIVTDNETFHVDDTPPTTTKEYGSPFYVGTGVWWDTGPHGSYWVYDYCTSDTMIYINATDSGDCAVGVDHIEFKVYRWDGSNYIAVAGPAWIPYTGPFNFSSLGDTNNCLHRILFRAVDKLGNTEDPYHRQHIMVDNLPPNSTKEVGDPHCEIAPDEYCITTTTPIWINATDNGTSGNCTVGSYTIHWVVWNDTGIYASGDSVNANVTIYIDEECNHTLGYWVEDGLGNRWPADGYHNETFHVDDTAPVIIKTVGDPHCEIAPDEYCVTTSTPITIDAYDLGCCDSLTVEYRIWYMGTWSAWTPITVPYELYFTEECTHYLEIRAYDCLGNTVIDNETFHVDDTAPVIDKVVGDPKVAGTGMPDYWVTTYTPITINASDAGCCDSLFVEISTDGANWTMVTVPYIFHFTEECYHNLYIRAYDCLGHIVYENETFYVDDTPPQVNKTIVGGGYSDGSNYYLPQSAVIYLNVTDLPDCAVGGWTLHYRIWWNGSYIVWENKTTNVSFSFTEDCIHYLEYYVNDSLGNRYPLSGWHNETFFVDSIAPTSTLIIGDPKYPHNQGATHITTDTWLVMYGDDDGCPDGNWMVHYRIWWNGNWSPEQIGSVWEVINITLTEECTHYIEYWATDLAGNEELPHHNRTLYVDDTPPDITLNVGSPSVSAGGDYWVTLNTSIWLNATDMGVTPDCTVGLFTIHYRTWYNGTWTSWMESDTNVSIDFTEECTHYLEYWVEDELGNRNPTSGVYNVTFYVGGGLPSASLELGSPSYGDYITKDTPVYINASGIPPHGSFMIYYRIRGYTSWYNGSWNENVTFTFADLGVLDNCSHIIDYNITNGLGEWDEYNHTVYVDNINPTINKDVGSPSYGDYVTSSTPFWINASDAGICSSGIAEIHYNIYYNGTWHNYTSTSNVTFTFGDFLWSDECEHIIEIWAVDNLGHESNHIVQTHYVDESGPIVEKEIGQPQYSGGYWITQNTPLWINATDTGCNGGAGIERIRVYLWVDWDNDNTWDTAYSPFPSGMVYDNDANDLDPTVGRISVVVYFAEDCHHLIEWNSWDYLGNSGGYHAQDHYVDTVPPDSTKEVGSPRCEIIPGVEYCITTTTPIWINATDNGTEPWCIVGSYTIHWVVWNDTGIYMQGTANNMNVTIYIDEECNHTLGYWVEDDLGNRWPADGYHNETFHVDDTYPVIVKTVGDPNVQVATNEYYVTTSTPITIDAYDLGCCDNLTVEYRIWYMGTWSDWTEVTVPYDLYFTEECTHYLEIKAYDCLGHIVTDNETFYVDDTPPVSYKTIGDPKYPESGPDEGRWVTTSTPIYLNATDMGECAVGSWRIHWEIWLNGSLIDSGVGDWYETVIIYFTEECNHTLIWWAEDDLGNMETPHIQTHYVDDTPPTTVKEYGNPKYGGLTSCEYHIILYDIYGDGWNNGYVDVYVNGIPIYTDLTLSTGAGPESYPIPVSDGDVIFVDYTYGSFPHENIYEITDCFDSTVVYMQCGHSDIDYDWTGTADVPSIPQFITSSTPIYLNATDGGLCAVGSYEIFYRIWYNGEWSDWQSGGLNTNVVIYVPDECKHYIEYYAVDDLGNTEEIHNQTFYVDNTPPTVTKEIGEPIYEVGPDEYYVTSYTPIWINATDMGICPVGSVHLRIGIWYDGAWTYYWYNVTNGTASALIYLPEECTHMVSYWAEDDLGNAIMEDVEIFHVDNTPPDVIKTVGEPKVEISPGEYYVTSWTPIWINVTDAGLCTVGSVHMLVGIWFNGTWTYEWVNITNGTINYGPIYLEGECTHYITYYIEDDLGNWVEDNETFYVDNSEVLIIKTIGEPKYEVVPGEVYYVTSSTPIWINATDMGIHPVGSVYLNVSIYSFLTGNWTYYEVTVPSGTASIGPIYLPEECEHWINITAIDDLGNTAYDNETFYVDNTDPIVEKEIGEPEYVPSLKEREVGRDTLLSEGFEVVGWPFWTIVSYAPGDNWQISGGEAWIEESSGEQDEWLISPTIDCSGETNIHLKFYHDFYNSTYSGDSFGEIYVSNDNGTTWNLVTKFETSEYGTKDYDISTWTNNEPDVKIAFRFYSTDGTSEYDDWTIDDVWVGSIGTSNNIVYEDFSTGLPSGWTIEDVNGNGNTWTWNSTRQMMNVTSTENGEEDNMTTTSFDCSAYDIVTLTFWSETRGINYCEVYVSNDGGVTWNFVADVYSSSPTAQWEVLDISEWAAGHNNVMVRWHFYNGYHSPPEYWGIDNIYINGTPTTEIFSDDFEIPLPAGWTMEVVNQPGYTAPEWSAVSTGTSPSCSPHSGSYMTKFNSYSCTYGSSARLYTYKVDFTDYMNCTLAFWMYHDSLYSYRDDKVVIQVSMDGSNWTNITEFLRYNASNPGWVEHTVDLSAYDNTDPYIAFLGVSDYGNNMYIDDIEVTGTPILPLIANAHGPYSGYVNQTIEFQGSATGGVPPYSYAWDIDGDGIYDYFVQNPSHIYTTPGTYTVTLNVTDAWGTWDTDTTTVEISEVSGSWVTMDTPIWINGTDVGICPSGIGEIHYVITYPDMHSEEFIVYGDSVLFYFTEECEHTLEFWSVDNLGHESEHTIQVHYVDSSPPATTISFGTPYYTNGMDIWITSSTTITLTAEDYPECAVGVNHTYYRINGGTWIEYTEPFTIDEECTHTIEYYSIDYLGNEEVHHIITVNVDDSPPATTLTYGTPYYTDGINEWITTSTPITLTAVDYPECAVGVMATYYRINGGTWIEYTEPFTIDEECTHTIEYYSIDYLGNEEPHHIVTVNVDDSPPVTTIDFGTPYYYDGNHWITSDTPITLTAVDEPECAVGVMATYYRIITDEYTTIWHEYTEPFYMPEECEHTIEYYSIDWLGNVEEVNSIVVYVDNSAPEIAPAVGDPHVNASDGYYITSDTPIDLGASDTGCNGGVGVDTIYYRIWYMGTWTSWTLYDGVPITLDGECVHYLEINATDLLGNTGFDNVTFYVDNSPPVSWLSGEMIFDDFIDPWSEFSIFVDDQGECEVGDYTIHFRITGPDGSMFYWFLDYYNCNGTWHTGFHSIPVSFQLRDEEGHAPRGIYTVEFWAEDDLGNAESPHNIEELKVDTVAPETTLSLDGPVYETTNVWISSLTQIVLTANDEDSGVSVVKYKIDDGIWHNYLNPIKISEPGMHTIYYYSIDNIGNEEEEKSYTVYVDNDVPLTNLNINGESVENGITWIKEGTTISFSSIDTETGVDAIYYRIDDGEWIEYAIPFTISTGEHVIEYYAVDNVANAEAKHAMEIGVDSTAPEINIDMPKASYLYIAGREIMPLPRFMHVDAIIIGKVNVKASASDECGINAVRIYINDELEYQTVENSVDWTWNEIAFGRYTITIEAEDNLGYTERKEVDIFVINLIPKKTTEQ
ncbi:MAG TPA: PKD domain-containing protein, partial [Thermoplasmatales archaeon]|nr:PKD domain-containing protein [Thermoplasmatales archaeon]